MSKPMLKSWGAQKAVDALADAGIEVRLSVPAAQKANAYTFDFETEEGALHAKNVLVQKGFTNVQVLARTSTYIFPNKIYRLIGKI